MAEVINTLGSGTLAVPYVAASGTMTVTPSTLLTTPIGQAFPSTPRFSVRLNAGAIYTVTGVATSGGNQVLSVTTEFGTDVNVPAGKLVIEVQTARSLTALLAASVSHPGGSAGDIQINDGSGGFAGETLLPIAHGGTGTATPALVAGTGISITGSWPGQTINATGGGGGGGGIGFNPTTQTDVTASRAIGTIFQNTTAAPIWVSVVVASSSVINAMTDGANPPLTLVASMPAGGYTIEFIVLPGNFYQVTASTPTLVAWIEWSGSATTPVYHYEYIRTVVSAATTPNLSAFNSRATLLSTGTNSPTSGFQEIGLVLFGAGGAEAAFAYHIPATWDGSAITLDIDANAAAGAGSLSLTPYSVGSPTDVNSVTWNTGTNVARTVPAGSNPSFTISLSVPLAGLVAGGLVYVAIARPATDTYTGNMFVFGASIGVKY